MSDVLLFPTRYDPFANVCLEANACGLPVVTTARNGFSEQVREDENGLILNEAIFTVGCDGAIDELSRLARFCSAPPAPERVREAVGTLSLESHTKALVELLEELHREKNVGRNA
jgi:UDP-glucose:(heptosyl)LPS alpha-1,3-glucosyltransferase